MPVSGGAVRERPSAADVVFEPRVDRGDAELPSFVDPAIPWDFVAM